MKGIEPCPPTMKTMGLSRTIIVYTIVTHHCLPFRSFIFEIGSQGSEGRCLQEQISLSEGYQRIKAENHPSGQFLRLPFFWVGSKAAPPPHFEGPFGPQPKTARCSHWRSPCCLKACSPSLPYSRWAAWPRLCGAGTHPGRPHRAHDLHAMRVSHCAVSAALTLPVKG